jgi:hypothetical protein
VGGPDGSLRVRELADLVREVVPGSRITRAEGAGSDPRSYRVDCSRLPATVPSFRPHESVAQGARELHESFAASGISVAEVEGPRYSRIQHVRALLESGELTARLRWAR